MGIFSVAIMNRLDAPTRPEGIMNWVEATGYLASALVLATFCMKTMIPLRCAAISSIIAFIVYGFYDGLYPVLVLHAILQPLNAWRAIKAGRGGLQRRSLYRMVKAVHERNVPESWRNNFQQRRLRRSSLH